MPEEEAQGASAIIIAERQVLLYPNKRSEWRFPGGTFEPGLDEDVEACCIREVLEETGIRLSRAALKKVLTYGTMTTPSSPSHSPVFIDHYFSARVSAENTWPSESSTMGAWVSTREALGWLSLDIDRCALELAVSGDM